jgi:hypothetical protein
MMKKQTLGWLAALGLLASGTSQAVIITFDGVPSTEVIQTSVTTEGFHIYSDHFHTYGVGPTYSTIAGNGGTHIGYEAVRGDPVFMQRVDGTTFTLLSLDVSEFYAVLSPDRPNANLLEIRGNFLDGSSVSHQLLLDGVIDGPDGLADFQHFALPSLFVDVISLEFVGLQWNGAVGGVAMDNLEIADRVSVPEPASLALFGIGLLGAGVIRRRRRTK